VLKAPGNQPLAFVYLSQLPYTGLDLGPVGTVAYWVALVAWSLAVAYLVLFIIIPYLARRMQGFAHAVSSTLNAEQFATETYTASAITAHAEPTPVGAPHVSKSTASVASDTRGYSSFDGFRSFAKAGALSVDDIVKGLAREASPSAHVEPIYENVEPMYQNVEPVQQAQPAPVVRETAPTAIAPEVPSFIEALLRGDREAVFSAVRNTVRTGGDAEAFLTQVVCALDDAYRARTEGTSVHPEIAHITKDCATPFLERLVTSLSTAVDSSYSVGITGAKLALTRALALVSA
jgi:hypothetical protein